MEEHKDAGYTLEEGSNEKEENATNMIKQLSLSAPRVETLPEMETHLSVKTSIHCAFDIIPLELKSLVLSHLDVVSICTASAVCSEWKSLLSHPSFWKILCWRDFPQYLTTVPLPEEDDNPDDRAEVTQEPEYPPTSQSPQVYGTDWKTFYIECFKATNLTGLWTAEYGVHGTLLSIASLNRVKGEELIKITQTGYNILAIKVTGDVNVPAGKITWKGTLCANKTKGRGRIQLADVGFVNSRWGKVSFSVCDPNTIKLVWHYRAAIHHPNIQLKWMYNKDFVMIFTRRPESPSSPHAE